MNTAEQIDIDQLAKAIAENLSKAVPPERVLWQADQCAEYMRVSISHFRARVCYLPNFPEPRKLSDGGRPKRRWLAREVMDWFEART